MANEKALQSSTEAVKKEDVKKLPFLKRVAKWWREMKSELKKVVWPTKKQVVNNTIVALVVMIVAAIVIWGFDQIARLIIEALITLTQG
jgi:preprotein translocase subunit SecE